MSSQPVITSGSDEDILVEAVTPGWKRCRLSSCYEMTITEPHRFRRFIKNDHHTVTPIDARVDTSQTLSPSDEYTRITLGELGCRTLHSVIFLEMNEEACRNDTDYKWMSDNHMCIDHVNGNRKDNRLENLQMISSRENSSRRHNGEQEMKGSSEYAHELSGGNLIRDDDTKGKTPLMYILPDVLLEKYSAHADTGGMPKDIAARLFTRNDDPRDILFVTGRYMDGERITRLYVRQISWNLSRRQTNMPLNGSQYTRTLSSLVPGNPACRKMIGDMILDYLREHLGPDIRFIDSKMATTLCNKIFLEKYPDIFFEMSSEDLCRMTDGELSITNKRISFRGEMERVITDRAIKEVIPLLGKKRLDAMKTLEKVVRDVYGYRDNKKYVATIVNRHIPDMTTDIMASLGATGEK